MLFVVIFVKLLAKQILVGDDAANLLQILFVGRIGNPKGDVSLGRILVLQVFSEAFPLFLLTFVRIVLQTKFHRAAKHGSRFKVAVGLGHNLPIYAAGSMA